MISIVALMGTGLIVGATPSAPLMAQGTEWPIQIQCIDMFDSAMLGGEDAPVLELAGDGGGCSASASASRSTVGSTEESGAATFQFKVTVAQNAPFNQVIVKFHRYWGEACQAFVAGSPLPSNANHVSVTTDAGTGYQHSISLVQSTSDQYSSIPTNPPTPGQIVAGQLSDLVFYVDLSVVDGAKIGTFFVTSTSLNATVTIGADDNAYSVPTMWGNSSAAWSSEVFYVGHP